MTLAALLMLMTVEATPLLRQPFPKCRAFHYRTLVQDVTLARIGRVASCTSSPQEEYNMPSTINLYQIGVWFCVGFFTGAGWAIAAWLIGRILRF